MNVISHGLDAAGETLRVGDDVAGVVAADLPAVVDHHVLVSGVSHAAAYDRVGRFLDDRSR